MTLEIQKPVRWNPRSVGLLILAWLLLQFGGLFSPGLLDDVDSIYIEIAREMLQRHDFVTPYVNGLRFFDKPPLMYWMAAGSMHVFGIHDWAARLPLALGVLALFLSVYALGNRLFRSVSPAAQPDRAGFYAALALATGIGPYLYTRFYIPDILIALWMTLAVHLFLIALERLQPESKRSALLPCLGFAAVMALNVLTKGLIGVVFPIGFVLLYLVLTRQLRLLPRLHLLSGSAAFVAIAAPWHILAALRNPAIALPAGLGLPAHGGWAWFYLYNEHIARFLSKRIPHDYGQTPVWLFWLYLAIWAMPWTTFLPAAIALHLRTLKSKLTGPRAPVPHLRDSLVAAAVAQAGRERGETALLTSTLESSAASEAVCSREREAALSLLLWAVLVLGFFSVSARQEYYSLPALPALALMAGGLLARADSDSEDGSRARRVTQRWSTLFLLPITTLVALVCGYFAIFAPRPAPGTTLSSLLASNPSLYNLSLGHIFDLTGAAMGLFRGPLAAVAIGMLLVGLVSTLLREKKRTYAANLAIAAGMIVTLLAAHAGLVRFNPILGSKDLALAINAVKAPGDLIVLDGEFTSGSTLVFYTGEPVHLVNGRVNGLWYGSFWPDSPHVFETDDSLRQLWAGPRRIFLLTYDEAARQRDLNRFASTYVLAESGGKAILTNRR
jgi:4-amino-4-deoxy-L-arabinose transferase-like glycosyltransferase